MCLERSERNDKNYELIEYLNDVNREHAEVLVEQNINGRTDTSYIYGAEIKGGFDRISLDRFDGSTGYYLYDARGSVSGITNEEGQVYQSYRYSVTGEITFGAPQYENEYTYNGESYNPNIESQYLRARYYCVVTATFLTEDSYPYRYSVTGEITFGAPQYENEYAYNGESYNPNIQSQYLRARYYCVVTATFLTEDSYLGSQTEPLTLNRYNYCVSSYLNYTDPSGNWLTITEEKMLSEKIQAMNSKDMNESIKWELLRRTTAFLSALHELQSPLANVDYALDNTQRNPSYCQKVIKQASMRRVNSTCTEQVKQNALYVLDEYLKGNISESYAKMYMMDLVNGEHALDVYIPTLYQERNYQRYDSWIIGWSKYYNLKYGTQINPNIIKAMMYKESKIGYDKSTSPNANISRDVLQALDVRNPNIYEYVKIDTRYIKIVTDIDESGEKTTWGERRKLNLSEIDINAMKNREEYAILKSLFNTQEDGNGNSYDGDYTSKTIYYYQYENVTPFLSIAIGVDTLRRKMNKTDSLEEAIRLYNVGTEGYASDVLKICEKKYKDLEKDIK